MTEHAYCRHCHRRKAYRNLRHLCQACYKDMTIRIRYPAYGNSDPTEEELNALIANQMAKLPSWWKKEEAKRTADIELGELLRTARKDKRRENRK